MKIQAVSLGLLLSTSLLNANGSLITSGQKPFAEMYSAMYLKTPSQRTYTLFPDGHFERKVCYTDGSCDPVEQGMWHKPKPGDPKHIEEVWQNGKWVIRVQQNY